MRASPRRVMRGSERKVQVLLAQDGDIIQFDRHGARIADKAPTGRILIDVTRIGEVGDEVLRDRRHLAGDGVVVAVVAINRQTGTLVGEPEIVARGFVVDEGRGDDAVPATRPTSSPSASRRRASRSAPIRG